MMMQHVFSLKDLWKSMASACLVCSTTTFWRAHWLTYRWSSAASVPRQFWHVMWLLTCRFVGCIIGLNEFWAYQVLIKSEENELLSCKPWRWLVLNLNEDSNVNRSFWPCDQSCRAWLVVGFSLIRPRRWDFSLFGLLHEHLSLDL